MKRKKQTIKMTSYFLRYPNNWIPAIEKYQTENNIVHFVDFIRGAIHDKIKKHL